MWIWMRTYTPNESRGFMWSKSPELDKINEELWNDPNNNDHSGLSCHKIYRKTKHNYSNEAFL